MKTTFTLLIALLLASSLSAAEPQRFDFAKRASEIDLAQRNCTPSNPGPVAAMKGRAGKGISYQ